MSFLTRLHAIDAAVQAAADEQRALYGLPVRFAPGEARQALLLCMALAENAIYLAARAAIQMRDEPLFQKLNSMEGNLSRMTHKVQNPR